MAMRQSVTMSRLPIHRKVDTCHHYNHHHYHHHYNYHHPHHHHLEHEAGGEVLPDHHRPLEGLLVEGLDVEAEVGVVQTWTIYQ